MQSSTHSSVPSGILADVLPPTRRNRDWRPDLDDATRRLLSALMAYPVLASGDYQRGLALIVRRSGDRLQESASEARRLPTAYFGQSESAFSSQEERPRRGRASKADTSASSCCVASNA